MKNPFVWDQPPTVDWLHIFSKSVLEFIRDLAVVGVVSYFAKRSDSQSLYVVSEIGKIALAVTVGTSLTGYKFIGWDMMKIPWLRNTLNYAYTIWPGILTYALISFAIGRAVEEIVSSQMR
jgi:hypothetical protein